MTKTNLLMMDLKTNIKRRMLILGLIILAGIITSFLNSFTNILLILLLPGFLLGIALALPHFNKTRKQVIAITTLPILMILLCIICAAIGMAFGMINNSYKDKTGVIILGAISSALFLLLLDQYYSILNKKTTFLIVILLGVVSALIGDILFLTPHSKELNFGKIIFVWETLVGLGLTFFARFDWMRDKLN